MRYRANRTLARVLAGIAILGWVAVLAGCDSGSGSGGGGNTQTRSGY